MPTIQQAQRKALQAGILDTLGQEQIANPDLSTFEAMAALYAEEFINKAIDNLNRDNSSHTGSLEDSMRFETVDEPAGKVLNIYVNDYYKFVDQGVKGVKNKSIASPYSFKGLWVSKSHRDAIERWIREGRKKRVVFDSFKYGATRQESKAISADKRTKTLAYLIARKQKRVGIKGTGFWTRAFDEVFKDFEIQMAKALGEDIRIDLRNMVKEINTKK